MRCLLGARAAAADYLLNNNIGPALRTATMQDDAAEEVEQTEPLAPSGQPVNPNNVPIGPCTNALLHKTAITARSSMCVFDTKTNLGERRFKAIMTAARANMVLAAGVLQSSCLRALYVEATLFALCSGDYTAIKLEAASRGASAAHFAETVEILVTRYAERMGREWLPLPAAAAHRAATLPATIEALRVCAWQPHAQLATAEQLNALHALATSVAALGARYQIGEEPSDELTAFVAEHREWPLDFMPSVAALCSDYPDRLIDWDMGPGLVQA